jgi:hypothetical protein
LAGLNSGFGFWENIKCKSNFLKYNIMHFAISLFATMPDINLSLYENRKKLKKIT